MPQVRMRDAGGVLRTIARIRMRDAGNVLRTIQRIRMRDAGGVLRTVYEYLSVTLDTYYEYHSDSGASGFGSVTSDPVTGTVSGGTAPFTYLWEYVSGTGSILPDTPTAIDTTFTGTLGGGALVDPAIYRLKVTDANGAIAYSPTVTIELEWFDTR